MNDDFADAKESSRDALDRKAIIKALRQKYEQDLLEQEREKFPPARIDNLKNRGPANACRGNEACKPYCLGNCKLWS